MMKTTNSKANPYFEALNTWDHNPYQALKEQALQANVPIISDEGLRFIFQLIKLKQPKRILEIGSAVGYSALQMHYHSKAEIVTLERDEAMVREARSNLLQISDHRITLLHADALDVDLSLLGHNFDILFIDAAKSQYTTFFNRFSPLLAKDGIIITDNIFFHGWVAEETFTSKNLKYLMRKLNGYNQFLKTHPDFDTVFYPLGDGMALSIKK